MSNYKHTTLTVAVHRETESPVFGEGTTKVSLDDESGGFFIVLEQELGRIRLDFEELKEVVKAARKLAAQGAIT